MKKQSKKNNWAQPIWLLNNTYISNDGELPSNNDNKKNNTS